MVVRDGGVAGGLSGRRARGPGGPAAPAQSNIGAAAIHSVCHIPQTGAMVQLASLRPLDSNQQPSSLRPSARRGGRRRRRRASGAG